MKRGLLAVVLIVTTFSIATRASADLYTATVTLPGSPTAVSTGNPINLSIDFQQSFSSINSIFWSGTFSGDLWDQNEQWQIDNFGQINPDTTSRSGFGSMVVDPNYLANFFDGQHAFQFQFLGSANLASLQAQIDGTAIPEASSFLCLGIVLLGTAAWRCGRLTWPRT